VFRHPYAYAAAHGAEAAPQPRQATPSPAPQPVASLWDVTVTPLSSLPSAHPSSEVPRSLRR
jgi:hypothetical protein